MKQTYKQKYSELRAEYLLLIDKHNNMCTERQELKKEINKFKLVFKEIIKDFDKL